MSEEQQESTGQRVLDELGPMGFMAEFFKYFGTARALQLIGWAALWGLQGVENGPEFRDHLSKLGVSQATSYRAAVDFRRFRQFLELRVGHPVTPQQLLDDLRDAEYYGEKPLRSHH